MKKNIEKIFNLKNNYLKIIGQKNFPNVVGTFANNMNIQNVIIKREIKNSLSIDNKIIIRRGVYSCHYTLECNKLVDIVYQLMGLVKIQNIIIYFKGAKYIFYKDLKKTYGLVFIAVNFGYKEPDGVKANITFNMESNILFETNFDKILVKYKKFYLSQGVNFNQAGNIIFCRLDLYQLKTARELLDLY